MKHRLIKLSDTHYIIVEHSIKGRAGYNYNFALGKVEKLSKNYEKHSSEWNFFRKITHSTQPLEENGEELVNGKWIPAYIFGDSVEKISLSDVEEAISGYSVEKMAWGLFGGSFEARNVESEEDADRTVNFGIECIKAHQELTKDKLFTIKDMKAAWRLGYDFATTGEGDLELLLPKTQGKVKFNLQGKLELI